MPGRFLKTPDERRVQDAVQAQLGLSVSPESTGGAGSQGMSVLYLGFGGPGAPAVEAVDAEPLAQRIWQVASSATTLPVTVSVTDKSFRTSTWDAALARSYEGA